MPCSAAKIEIIQRVWEPLTLQTTNLIDCDLSMSHKARLSAIIERIDREFRNSVETVTFFFLDILDASIPLGRVLSGSTHDINKLVIDGL